MLKHLQIKHKAGFTLIEMIITVALAAIFFTVVALVLPQWVRTYQSSIELNDSNQIVNNVINGIREEIGYALSVTCDGTDDDRFLTYKRSSTVQEKKIGLGATNPTIPGLVYEENSAFYMGFNVTLEASIEETGTAGKKMCVLTVSVKKNEEEIISRTRNIRLYGLID